MYKCLIYIYGVLRGTIHLHMNTHIQIHLILKCIKTFRQYIMITELLLILVFDRK